MQQKHIQISDSHVQLVQRINKLLAVIYPMKGNVALMAILVGRFDTYCVISEVRESAVGESLPSSSQLRQIEAAT